MWILDYVDSSVNGCGFVLYFLMNQLLGYIIVFFKWCWLDVFYQGCVQFSFSTWLVLLVILSL